MSTAITKQGGGWAIAPANMGELYRFAELLAGSDLVPKDYREKPGNCLVAIQMGGELGLSPMQSIQNIAVINGRPSLWGDALLGVCLPHVDNISESDDGATATCVVVRGKRTVTATFSTEDAKRAGLSGKSGPWTQYPQRMRQMRARSFALRDACADILRGVQSAEESQDIQPEVRAEVMSSKTVDEPKPKEERKSEPPPPAAAKPVGPVFAITWPDKQWAGKLLKDAPVETFDDYVAWLRSVLGDNSRERLHKKAQKHLDEVSAEIDSRIAADAAKASAEAEQQEQGDNTPVEQDRDSWGLTP